MIDYGRVYGKTIPPELDITTQAVYIASNIEPYTEELDGEVISGYAYDYVSYTKDEYLLLLSQRSQELEEELAATKIILGVE